MERYRANGAQLSWLLIPEQQAVEIWSAGDAAPLRLAPAEWLDADDLFPGLRIDLAELWAG
jgi:Uma2 family endonuclease